ncbi:hypothetical protein LX36DRAFT_85063 [Colletotrichum falcatum]|nr:hypothetical protein LX36DRAFT_85063 [Colletotrichum falcatum]
MSVLTEHTQERGLGFTPAWLGSPATWLGSECKGGGGGRKCRPTKRETITTWTPSGRLVQQACRFSICRLTCLVLSSPGPYMRPTVTEKGVNGLILSRNLTKTCSLASAVRPVSGPGSHDSPDDQRGTYKLSGKNIDLYLAKHPRLRSVT